MARQKGMLNLSGNLEPLAGAPLDSRSITPTVADLYIASNWPYKYIGMKTTVTATGDTYRLVNLDVTQESSWVKEGGESGQTIQYDELPAASSTLVGKIYQYTGVTNVQYTNGYFYECVLDGGTYKWQQTNTQPGTSYSDFTGATSQAAGAHGLVPAPTTGDISKFLKGDGTWATVPMPSFDYSNTSPEAMNFSTDEKVIGTWIDGKPLYQKVITNTTNADSSGTKVIGTISNIDTVFITEACVETNVINGIGRCWGNIDSNKSIGDLYVNPDNGQVIFYTINSTYFNKSIVVILRYTKTTDTAVASGEKIVGQWIDGKPLYEKTFVNASLTSIPTDTWVDYAELNNADELISFSFGRIENSKRKDVFGNCCGGFYKANTLQVIARGSTIDCSSGSIVTIQYTKTTN